MTEEQKAARKTLIANNQGMGRGPEAHAPYQSGAADFGQSLTKQISE